MKKLITLLTMFLVTGMAAGKTHKFRNNKLVVERSDVGVPFFIGPDTFLIREAYLSEKDQRIDWVEGKQRYSFWDNGDTLPLMTDQKWIWSVSYDNLKKANKLFITTEEEAKDTIIRKVYCYQRAGKKFVWNKKTPKINKIPPLTNKPTPIKQNKNKKQIASIY